MVQSFLSCDRSRGSLRRAPQLLLAVGALAFVGCAGAPEPEPATSAPVESPAEKGTPLSNNTLTSRFELRALKGSEAKTWEPGTSARLRVWITHRGEPLVDYPSLVVESLTPGVTVADSERVLYGLTEEEDPHEFEWGLASEGGLTRGAGVRIRVQLFSHNSDRGAGKAALQESTLDLEVGQTFSE